MHIGLMERSYLFERTAQQLNGGRIGVQEHTGLSVGDQQRFPGSPENVAILALVPR
jgi:hypothetical protein